ncbi:hypothetical protein, partial [Aeromonas sp. QDB05]|uniref:hypothetical protein n=1 Tax=Aeromonas sp. QDB05 TaxID=2990478 RepID=UPI0022E08DC9
EQLDNLGITGASSAVHDTPLPRIRGAYGKSKPLFAAYQPARWLVLQGVISHSAPHYPLCRSIP